MSHVRVLITEDDFSFGLELVMLVEEIGHEVLALKDNADEALELIRQNPPDVILMDIDIKGSMNGLELAKAIKSLRIPVIFITCIQRVDYYEQARDLAAVAFLVKPVEKITLRSSIELTLRNLGKTKKREKNLAHEDFPEKDIFFFKKNNNLHRVHFHDILLVESFKNYCTIHTSQSRFLLRSTITAIESQLPPELFLRVHRSFIINLSKIETVEFTKGKVRLPDLEVPLGKSYRQSLLEKIGPRAAP